MDVNGSNEVVCADFARQLERELAELREWKRQAMMVMPDFQQIGTELGLTVGDNVCAEILPGIRRLNRELAEATKQRDALADALSQVLDNDGVLVRTAAREALATLEGRGSNPAQKSPPATP
jgi:hypothetical protein